MSTRLDIRNMIRQQLGLWPDTDPLNANIADATTTSVTVTNASRAPVGSLIEIENEVMFVRASNETTQVLTVRRGDRGSTAAAHTMPLTVSIYGPLELTNTDLNRLIRDGIHWLYPDVVRDIWDESLTTLLGVVSYTIPAGIDVVDEVYMKDSVTPFNWAQLVWWKRVGTKIFVPFELPVGRGLLIHGRGRFTQPSSDSTVLDLGDELLQAVYLYCLAGVVKHRDLLRSQFTGQSALLESRAAGLSELIGSYRDLMRQATEIKLSQAKPHPSRLRRIKRHG